MGENILGHESLGEKDNLRKKKKRALIGSICAI